MSSAAKRTKGWSLTIIGIAWGCGGEQAPTGSTVEGPLPAVTSEQGYVGSQACRSCHPREFETWSQTFHRTMTQPATPQTLGAPIEGVVSLQSRGRRFELWREGETVWVELDDPDHEDPQTDAPRVRRRLVMLTGSHWEQRLWVESEQGARLDLLPVVWRTEERMWVNDRDIFLNTSQAEGSVRAGSWNHNCVRCHSTGGIGGTREEPPQTRVGELGIACEMCHGPGEDHVSHSGDPSRIVNPANLDHERASDVCGQCHVTASDIDRDRWASEGPAFRPGDVLDGLDRLILTYAPEPTEPWTERWFEGSPPRIESKFWPDGTVLPGGREYNGLLESECFLEGDMSCASCHSAHAFESPYAMLGAGKGTDVACTQCHTELSGEAATAHTHHPAASEGSRCMGCHMPPTTWAVMKATPSHHIDSPSVANTLTSGRPNACNLCHLDRTVAWSAERLTQWYGAAPVEPSENDRELAAAVRWLLEGHAVQRGIAAWAMGWSPAQAASGTDWLAPILAQALDDDIAVVRFAAARSLRTLPGYEGLEYDHAAAPHERRAVRDAVVEGALTPATRPTGGSSVLLGPDGELDLEMVAELLERQDRREIRVGE